MNLRHLIGNEFVANLDPPNLAARLITAPLPVGTGSALRTQIMRMCGFDIGRTTTILGPIRVTGGRRASSNLHIGERCFINLGAIIDASTEVHVEDDVAFGQDVLVTTSSHRFGHPDHRAGDLDLRPVRIERGAWVAARAVVLPGVTVGAGAVVMAGAVVSASIPPHTMAGGVPARVIRSIPEIPEASDVADVPPDGDRGGRGTA